MDLSELKISFSSYLHSSLEELLEPYPSYRPYTIEYVEKGGKQVRPLLFLEACTTWQAQITTETLGLATGIELLHNFFLIHDDIMDNDELRRDKQTLHVYFGKNTSPVAGRAIALVLGDILYTYALQLLEKYSPKELTAHILRDTLAIAAETAKGQLLEFTSHTIPKKEALLEFYKKKTAAYSIHLPLLLAAHISGKGTDPLYQETIPRISHNLGIAYQLYDDLIEVTGTKRRMEHSDRCGDLMRAKMTPLLIDTFPHLSKEVQATIESAYTQQQIIDLETERLILQTMKEHRIREATQELITSYLDAAEQDLILLGLEKTQTITSLLSSYRHAPIPA